MSVVSEMGNTGVQGRPWSTLSPLCKEKWTFLALGKKKKKSLMSSDEKAKTVLIEVHVTAGH